MNEITISNLDSVTFDQINCNRNIGSLPTKTVTLNVTAPDSFCISPSIAEIMEVLPAPTCPTTANNLPFFTWRFMLQSNISKGYYFEHVTGVIIVLSK